MACCLRGMQITERVKVKDSHFTFRRDGNVGLPDLSGLGHTLALDDILLGHSFNWENLKELVLHCRIGTKDVDACKTEPACRGLYEAKERSADTEGAAMTMTKSLSGRQLATAGSARACSLCSAKCGIATCR